jgi:hypothetical protein
MTVMEADEKLEDILLDVHGLDCLDCEPVREEIRAHIRQHYVPMSVAKQMLEALGAMSVREHSGVYVLAHIHGCGYDGMKNSEMIERILSEYGYSDQPAEEENDE